MFPRPFISRLNKNAELNGANNVNSISPVLPKGSANVKVGTGRSGGGDWCGTSVKIRMGRCRVELGVGTGVKIWTGRVFSVGSKWCGNF